MYYYYYIYSSYTSSLLFVSRCPPCICQVFAFGQGRNGLAKEGAESRYFRNSCRVDLATATVTVGFRQAWVACESAHTHLPYKAFKWRKYAGLRGRRCNKTDAVVCREADTQAAANAVMGSATCCDKGQEAYRSLRNIMDLHFTTTPQSVAKHDREETRLHSSCRNSNHNLSYKRSNGGNRWASLPGIQRGM